MTTTSLGRGLSALLDAEVVSLVKNEGVSAHMKEGQVLYISVNDISPGPFQPRQYFDQTHLEDLANSIKTQGILQPLIVRPLDRSVISYEIVAGERRWQAAKLAGLSQVPVIVKNLDDRQTLEVAITENVQRADLNPIEEAEGYSKLLLDFGHTQEDVALKVGKSRSHIANTLRLLTLPPKVRELIEKGALSAGHARSLIGTEKPEELAHQIVNNQLNVRETEEMVREIKAKPEKRAVLQKNEDLIKLEETLEDALGAKVSIYLKGNGGEIKVRFSSLEELDGIIHRINM